MIAVIVAVLQDVDISARLRFACRLAAKATDTGNHSYLHVAGAAKQVGDDDAAGAVGELGLDRVGGDVEGLWIDARRIKTPSLKKAKSVR